MDVFISYSWSCKGLADGLEKILEREPTFRVIRDIHAIQFGEGIKEFMLSIRKCFCALILLDNDYLSSENCLYELTTLSKEYNFKTKAIPVVTTGTRIFKTEDINDYVEYWQSKYPNGMAFHPEELRCIFKAISDLKCISCNPDKETSIEQCGQTILAILTQRLFQLERRQPGIIPHRVSLGNRPILAIDFGTSYTLAAIVDENGRTFMVHDFTGGASFPSLIEINDDGSYMIGNSATSYPSNTNFYLVRELKRSILKTNQITFDNHCFSIKMLVSMLIHSIKSNAEEEFRVQFTKVLLSAPVDFHTREISLLTQAAESAGLDVVRVIQESSIAALQIFSQLDASIDSEFLVIDFGGGTIDICGANTGDGICEILFTIGDRSLGSIDYDNLVAKYIVTYLEQKCNQSPIYPNTPIHAVILQHAEKVKIDLGISDSVIIHVKIPNNLGDISIYALQISRDLYLDITHKLSDQIYKMLIQVKESFYNNCLMEGHGPDAIYLTGQGSKLFLMYRLIQSVFPGIKIYDKFEESAVCRGLALQSGILSGFVMETLLMETFHHNIAILCDHYDEDLEVIYIGNPNHTYYMLVGSDTDSVNEYNETIPWIKEFEISFTKNSIEGGCKIQIFDFCRVDHSYTQLISLPIPPKKIVEKRMYLRLDTDPNGNLSANVSSESYFKKKSGFHFSTS